MKYLLEDDMYLVWLLILAVVGICIIIIRDASKSKITIEEIKE